ncbi:MAG: hypothetical protein J7J51_05295 [Candidatus Omnitrophica bacterium]|nr:hypothetical protein [Candidatus Omnitrophota bacterium]
MMETFRALWFKKVWKKAEVKQIGGKVYIKFYMKDGKVLEVEVNYKEWKEFWDTYYNIPLENII